VDLAAKNRLPAVYTSREFVDAGGLMAYGPNLADRYRRAALRTPTRANRFAVCVKSDQAEDLEVWKVYRVVPDTRAAAEGCLRVIDESGEDYLYPADYFVFVELPEKARRAWPASSRRASSRKAGPPNSTLQRTRFARR